MSDADIAVGDPGQIPTRRHTVRRTAAPAHRGQPGTGSGSSRGSVTCNVFTSLLAARLGDETTAVAAQDTARAELPATLPRFATHLEMHRGLMLARSGDVAAGTAHARAALPPEKHSLTLRLLMTEVERS